MKIAFIGIRGVPIIYSGFESFAENLGVSLVEKKQKVFVYCRKQYFQKNINVYKGINLIKIPCINNKNFETISHGFLSMFHAIFFARPDIIYFFGVGNAIFTFLPRMFGIKTIINVDGLDWRREKWGFFARQYLLACEYLSSWFPNATITDSKYMEKYYEKKYHKKTVYIPYGVKFDFKINNKILNRYDLKPGKYLVWVGRLVPDNHLEELIEAYKGIKTIMPLVIIGDDFYKGKYYNRINKLIKKDKKIIKTGFVNRNIYASLVKNSLAYIETKRSGGTHPSLIEAMKLASLVISNDDIANRQILNRSCLFYRKGDNQSLSNVINKALKFKKNKLETYRKNIKKEVARFSWTKINNQYNKLIQSLQ